MAGRRDRGSLALEFAVLAPGLVVLLWLMISAGRVVDARSRVEGAARDAARAASINHNDNPWGAAQAAMVSALEASGTSCAGGPQVVDQVAISPDGVAHTDPEPEDRVEIEISCDVAVLLGDFSVTVQRRGFSVLDTYRGTS